MKKNSKNKNIILNKRKTKGFVFSLQSAIAVIILTLLIFSIPPVKNDSLKELAIIQQENDLLRVWSAKETSENEIINDTKLVFGKNYEIYINGEKIYSNNNEQKSNCISSSGTIIQKPFLIEKNITISVCTN